MDNSLDLILYQVIDDLRFEEDKVCYVEFEFGQILLYDVYFLYGLVVNQLGDCWVGFVMCYMLLILVLWCDLDMSQISKLDWIQILFLLVRGQNWYVDNDFEIGYWFGLVG